MTARCECVQLLLRQAHALDQDLDLVGSSEHQTMIWLDIKEFSSMSLQKKNILVVEDCPDQQRLLLSILQRVGATVTLECSGSAAIDTIRRQHRALKKFDAVVMDLILDEADGITATRSIRALEPLLPVVAITASGSAAIERSWREAGCCAYLEKPFSHQKLVESLQTATREAARDWLFKVRLQQLMDEKTSTATV